MTQINDQLILEFLTVGPFQTNVYVVGCARTKTGVIIDAGGDGPGLLQQIDAHNLNLTMILQTHAHIDHVAALNDVIAQRKVPIYLHPDDGPMYQAAPQQGMMFGMQLAPLPPVDHWLTDGQCIAIGDLEAKVILLPGHSPGSVIFYFEAQDTMVSGDVLFKGSIGRTDLPGGDVQAMKASLAKLKTYPPQTLIYSGHGPVTSLGEELKTNPYLTQNW